MEAYDDFEDDFDDFDYEDEVCFLSSAIDNDNQRKVNDLFEEYTEFNEEVLINKDEINKNEVDITFKINNVFSIPAIKLSFLGSVPQVSLSKDENNYYLNILKERINKDIELFLDIDDSDKKKLDERILFEINHFNPKESAVRDDSEKLHSDISNEKKIKIYYDRIKSFISLKKGLKKLYFIIRNAVLNIDSCCMCCGQKLIINNGPWVCDNKWCQYRVCFSMPSLLEGFTKIYPENVEYVIKIISESVNHTKAYKILEPYPESFPTWEELKPQLLCIGDNKKLLWWAIINMHSRLVTVCSGPDELDLKDQRLLQVVPSHCPREIFFQKEKEKRGSEYFFHGSALFNWYSILKFGLINMSKKEGLMIHGAAHGEGIYMSKSLITAQTYKKDGYVGIVEVIKGEAIKKTTSIHTLKNDKMIRLRYIIL